jgi:ubiquitin-conjugating enzyme E2 variant
MTFPAFPDAVPALAHLAALPGLAVAAGPASEFAGFMLKLTFEAVLVVLLVDLVSGLGHWLEDTYGNPDTPLIGRLVIVPNLEHHRHPRAFLAKSWLESCGDLMLAGAALVAAAWALDLLTWHVMLFALVGSQANQIHKWTHQNPQEKGALVHLMQRMRLLQTPREHGRHHQGATDSHYCTVTNALNPMLEQLRVWRRLENLLERSFGLRPRTDASTGARAAGRAAARPAVKPRAGAVSPAVRVPMPSSVRR